MLIILHILKFGQDLPLNIQKELSLFRAAMASTTCGISICDARKPDMPLIYVNEAFCRMTGYAEEEVLNDNCRFLQGKTGSKKRAL